MLMRSNTRNRDEVLTRCLTLSLDAAGPADGVSCETERLHCVISAEGQKFTLTFFIVESSQMVLEKKEVYLDGGVHTLSLSLL